MTSLTFQRRHLRRTAALTLMAWVLALLAGLVNACQVQPHGSGTQAPVAAARGVAAERGKYATQVPYRDRVDQDAAGEHGGPSPDTGKSDCLKFCDDESSSLPSGEASQPDLPGMVRVARIEWQPASPTVTAETGGAAERHVSQGPALFIRFRRLTI